MPVVNKFEEELFALRRDAHLAFDQIWKTGKLSRTGAYTWLRLKMNKSGWLAHIRTFSAEECRRLIKYVEEFGIVHKLDKK